MHVVCDMSTTEVHVCVHVGQIDGTWIDNLGSDTNEATSTLTEEMDVGSP